MLRGPNCRLGPFLGILELLLSPWEKGSEVFLRKETGSERKIHPVLDKWRKKSWSTVDGQQLTAICVRGLGSAVDRGLLAVDKFF